ncbi:YbaB/EbfC family nucleoid-associated protein [Buchnera aphidicola]|uniref:YbaB/EbfC family nucleoid-associated protein n=1 Tax=Buchnera aphidicola TaxID=9 RepID=UPI0022382694|nr:YbaB/EbfC family nucleoid-associated protein [Buchnera aphidicola]MCW5197516.1 YbaB/EbfC family nucleoid-associated protein [Buchnera aphidicola (Chaitophorus viminalis)]
MFKKNQFGNLMQKAQKMQENMKKIQKQMKSIIVQGESGAGLVKITLNGEHHCKVVDIDSSLFKDDEKEIIEDLIIAAFNDASRKIKEAQKKKMKELSGIIPLPNNLNFPI